MCDLLSIARPPPLSGLVLSVDLIFVGGLTRPTLRMNSDSDAHISQDEQVRRELPKV